MNQKYKDKMKRNFKLINSKQFVKVLSSEIRYNNFQRIRFFSNGDISSNQKQGIKQLDNICKLCLKCTNNLFWITTRNFNVLFEYFSTNKKPDNANFMLSVDFAANDFITKFCFENKIQISLISDNRIESNCLSSINHKSCIDNNCDKCFYYDIKPRVWLIHGKGNKDKFKKIE